MSELQLLGCGSVLTANRMLFPAGTSLQEAGKSGLRFKKDIPVFFCWSPYFGWSTELTQLHGQQCGSCCVSLQGLSAAGLLPDAWRDFTAFSSRFHS